MALKLLQADLSDLEFICDLMLEETRAGHFAPRHMDPNAPELFRENLRSIITHGRHLDQNLRAQAIVVEEDGQRVGFVIMSEMFEGRGGNELAAIVVAKAFRGRGYGSRILDEVLGRWLPHAEVHVQCLPASETLYRMLLARGFEHFDTTDTGLRLLRSRGHHDKSASRAGSDEDST